MYMSGASKPEGRRYDVPRDKPEGLRYDVPRDKPEGLRYDVPRDKPEGLRYDVPRGNTTNKKVKGIQAPPLTFLFLLCVL
jgi:hypothetical protein